MHKEQRRLRIGLLGCGPISQAAHLDAGIAAVRAMVAISHSVFHERRIALADVSEPVLTSLDAGELLSLPLRMAA